MRSAVRSRLSPPCKKPWNHWDFKAFSLSAHFREIAQAPVIMESVWNPFGMPAWKSVLSSCSVYFRKAFSELFRLLSDFREKYFSWNFKQFRHFWKIFFKISELFPDFLFFQPAACLIWNASQLFENEQFGLVSELLILLLEKPSFHIEIENTSWTFRENSCLYSLWQL